MFDDYETVSPPERWIGDASLDEIRPTEARCDVEPMVEATFELLSDLRASRRFVLDDADIEALTRVRDKDWARFVDPALSSGAHGRAQNRIVLWECGEHMLEIRGVGNVWSVFRDGKRVGSSDVDFDGTASEPKNDPYEPELQQDEEYDMSVAERRHLLGRAQQAEHELKRAKVAAEKQVSSIRLELDQQTASSERAIRELKAQFDAERRHLLGRAQQAEQELKRAKVAAEKQVSSIRLELDQLTASSEEATRDLATQLDSERRRTLEQQSEIEAAEKSRMDLEVELRRANERVSQLEIDAAKLTSDCRELVDQLADARRDNATVSAVSDGQARDLDATRADLLRVRSEYSAIEADLRRANEDFERRSQRGEGQLRELRVQTAAAIAREPDERTRSNSLLQELASVRQRLSVAEEEIRQLEWSRQQLVAEVIDKVPKRFVRRLTQL